MLLVFIRLMNINFFKVVYLGIKYYRDIVKQDSMKEIVLIFDSRFYTISNLMEGVDYMINVYLQFNGRGVGFKSSIMGKIKIWCMYVGSFFLFFVYYYICVIL